METGSKPLELKLNYKLSIIAALSLIIVGSAAGNTYIDNTKVQTDNLDVQTGLLSDLNFQKYSLDGVSSDGRSLTSNQSKTVSVCSSGCDYSKIQNAVDDAPIFLDETEKYLIDVSAGTYNEDVTIQNIHGNGKGAIEIRGPDASNPSDVKIDTVFVGYSNANVVLRNFQITDQGNQIRQADEKCGLVAEQAKRVIVRDVSFDNTHCGAVSYATHEVAMDQNVTFNDLDHAFKVKHGGRLVTYNAEDIKGNVTDVVSLQSGVFKWNSKKVSMTYKNVIDNDVRDRGHIFDTNIAGGAFTFPGSIESNRLAIGDVKAENVDKNNAKISGGGSISYVVNGGSSGSNGLKILRDGNSEWGLVSRGVQNNNLQFLDNENSKLRFEIDKSDGKKILHNGGLDLNGEKVVDGSNDVFKSGTSGNLAVSNKLKLNDNVISNQSALDIHTNGNGGIVRIVNGNDGSTIVRFNEGGSIQVKGSNVEILNNHKLFVGDVEVSKNSVENADIFNLKSTTLPTCDSSTEGDIRYDGSKHYGCDGSSWSAMY